MRERENRERDIKREYIIYIYKEASFSPTSTSSKKRFLFLFFKKEGFEFSHSPEHTFTSGAIYCLKAEIFSASPHWGYTLLKESTALQYCLLAWTTPPAPLLGAAVYSWVFKSRNVFCTRQHMLMRDF